MVDELRHAFELAQQQPEEMQPWPSYLAGSSPSFTLLVRCWLPR